ncbi:hypothetical protein BO99DRAFT_404865 [Aspergillus violaceofuscus CBS 115571]|uniref:CCHC-type domain-containing protein n=1 Tax=Aspergillus violaceofuscus (strain CBS 115571) TaxID=1450538 RepID=A0A2V5GZT4_ASPV1|nr:hypothetical protein BO99DRAFT_404865 [Aspergillus violaceofuscus CBS 115571]
MSPAAARFPVPPSVSVPQDISFTMSKLIYGLLAKQCYNCQGVGHVQADCPTLRLNNANGRCYNCGQPGHIAVCRRST